MSDRLDELSQLRADVPPPSHDSLRRARARMMDGRRPSVWRSRPWLKAGLAGGMALALSAGFVLFQGVELPSPQGTHDVKFGQPANAEVVLNRAADAVQEQQATERPRNDQFIYQKTLWRDTEDGDRPGESWTRFRQTDLGSDGDHRTPEMIWDYNQSLPEDPDRLREEIYAEVERIYADWDWDEKDLDRDERALWLSATILGASDGLPAPPAQRAALFRMMSTIPDVKVQVGFEDIVGRKGIYVYRGEAGDREGYIFAEDTYNYLGRHAEIPGTPREVVEKENPKLPDRTIDELASPLTIDEILLERKVVDQKDDT